MKWPWPLTLSLCSRRFYAKNLFLRVGNYWNKIETWNWHQMKAKTMANISSWHLATLDHSFVPFFALKVRTRKRWKSNFWTVQATAFKLVAFALEWRFHPEKTYDTCHIGPGWPKYRPERPSFTAGHLFKQLPVAFDHLPYDQISVLVSIEVLSESWQRNGLTISC